MNKTVYNILTSLAALASAALISSCDDFERKVVVPEIDIPDEVEVDALADRQNIVLKSTYPWFAEANESWITLHKYRGQALIRDSIVFELTNNGSLDSRTGSIDIRLMGPDDKADKYCPGRTWRIYNARKFTPLFQQEQGGSGYPCQDES